MECSHKLEHSSKGGGLFSGTSSLAGTFAIVEGRCMVVGLGAVTGLELLRCCPFSLFCGAVLPNAGVCIRQWGPRLASRHWTHFPFHFQKCFHLFNYSMVGAESCVPWCTHVQLGCPISPEYVCPLHGCNLYFYMDHLYQEFAPKEAMQKVAFWLK